MAEAKKDSKKILGKWELILSILIVVYIGLGVLDKLPDQLDPLSLQSETEHQFSHVAAIGSPAKPALCLGSDYPIVQRAIRRKGLRNPLYQLEGQRLHVITGDCNGNTSEFVRPAASPTLTSTTKFHVWAMKGERRLPVPTIYPRRKHRR